jgi:hypothetical protein
VSSKAERTRVTLAFSSMKSFVTRAAPTQPVRVVPPPSTERPSVSLNTRSLSTWVRKKTERTLTAAASKVCAYATPASSATTLANGVATSCVT